MEAEENNVVVDGSNMEVPVTEQETQMITKIEVYEQVYKNVKPTMTQSFSFICEICKSGFSQQLKFFEHLKNHYGDMEDTQEESTQQSVAVAVDVVVPEVEELCGVNASVGVVPESVGREDFPSEDRIERIDTTLNPNPKATRSSAKKDRPERSDETAKPVFTKVLLSCPKCKRTFRREKTYEAHVDSCQKQVSVEEEAGNYENLNIEPRKKPKASKRKVKVEVVEMEEIVGEIIDEDVELEETMERIQDPLQDEDLFEDDENLLAGDKLFSEDGHQCMFCDDAFPSKVKLELHLKKVHAEESSLNGPKSKKKRASSGGKRQGDVLKCPQCQRIFNHRNSLVYHMRSHTGERPHQCEMCGKSFFATSALKVHMRLHSGEKPYKCESCGRNFRQWGDLKYHMISIHSDIRQYQCEFCGKDFARKYSLIVHRRIHTGERNYKCEFCNKCFRAASYLQNHRRIHTGKKPHACTICGKPFRVRSDMKRHMASHNRESRHTHNSTNQVHPPTPTVQNIVTVSSTNNPNQQQIITIGPQISQQIAQAVRAGNAIQVPVSSESVLQQGQQIALEDGNEVVITGDIVDGTPINITLTQEGLAAHSSLEAAAVATLQPVEMQEGVLYSNRDGTLETVTIRESNTGTLYVWPVFMN